jgi:hypothetical protein
MAVAKIYPEPEKGGRGRKVFRDETVSKQGISKARTVLKFAPDRADRDAAVGVLGEIMRQLDGDEGAQP